MHFRPKTTKGRLKKSDTGQSRTCIFYVLAVLMDLGQLTVGVSRFKIYSDRTLNFIPLKFFKILFRFENLLHGHRDISKRSVSL